MLSFILAIPCLSSADPIELAVIVAQTGKAKAYGDAAIQGARVAEKEINDSGGLLGLPLKLVIIDNQSTPLSAKQAAQKAIQRNVAGVVGAIWSTHSLAIAKPLQKAGVPMVSPGSTAPQVTRVGSYIFRTCYTDDFQGKLMAGFARYSLALTTAAVLTNISETHSQVLGERFTEAFTIYGGRIVMQGGYKGSAMDFSDLLTSLKQFAPQAVFVPGYAHDSGLLIKQAGNMGIQALFLGGDAWETGISEYAGRRLEGSYFSTHWHRDLPYKRSRHFIAQFKAMHGSAEISAYAPLAYDAVWLFAQAIKNAKMLKKSRIRDQLAAIKDYPGATGVFRFTADGDPVNKCAAILKYEAGQWRFHKVFELQP